ncbi:MAG: RpiB/LacA/LacB family sugar-phosphate isomerase [Phenylobacterium sp.]|nr:RpiB/LacA/LacB family sugar-phosphate isomerase [Phenylobacterium sp.]
MATSRGRVGTWWTSGRRRPRARPIRSTARRVASGDCRFGIILCGTGQGIMMAANKVKGVRCGVCADTFSARMIRQHNDANMLAIGARVVGEGLALDIVDAFLSAPFDGGRHAPRVEMIKALEA